MNRVSSWLPVAILVVVLVAIDQAFKFWILANIPFREGISVVPGAFYLVNLANTGIVGGVGMQTAGLVPVLALMTAVLLAIVFSLFVVYERMARSSTLTRVFLVFSCAPLLCTLIDRIRLGYVVDFVAFRGLPVFNFADLLPLIGIIALIVEIVLYARSSHDATNRTMAMEKSYIQES